MNKFLAAAKHSVQSFAKDEEGAQIVEYALIIAVVSIALIGALSVLVGPGNPFTAFVTKVGNCLSGTC